MDRQYYKQNISPVDTYANTVSHTLNIISNVVGATYGPYGTHNLFRNGPEVKASKDGFENITMMKFDGSIAQTVLQMVNELASHQAFTVGDGTTSAVLIMAAVYNELVNSENYKNKYTPSEIAMSMDLIQKNIVALLQSLARKLDTPTEVRDLIYTSVDGNEELTDLLMGLYSNTLNLEDKNIIIDYSATDESFIRTIQGINVLGKMMNPTFANQDTETCALKNVEVLVIDGKAVILNDILTYVNNLKKVGRSLLIICSGVNENFYRYIEAVSQQQPEILRNFCVAYSSANMIQDKDAFQDILKLTSCVYLPENTEISAQSIQGLAKGIAENAVIKGKKITLAGFTKTEQFMNHVSMLQTRLNELEVESLSGTLSSEDKMKNRVEQNKLRSRIETLTDGVTTVYVGGDSTQRKSINYRLTEDGIKALQSTMKHGYTFGCNTTVMNILVKMYIIEFESGQPNELLLKLVSSILTAYISVYRRLILNRKKMEIDEIMKLILTDEAYALYDKENDRIDIRQVSTFYVFRTLDLRGNTEKHIINPVKTDINIVERAIDLALVLATSNTVMVEEMEFTAEV